MWQQMGVAIPGGLTAMVLELEAELRLDVERRGLQLDKRNMFNEVCRVILQEDLLAHCYM